MSAFAGRKKSEQVSSRDLRRARRLGVVVAPVIPTLLRRQLGCQLGCQLRYHQLGCQLRRQLSLHELGILHLGRLVVLIVLYGDS